MKKHILIFIILLDFSCTYSQDIKIDHSKIEEDLNEILANISENYAYLKEKNVDLTCIKEYYEKQIPSIETEEQSVLFF